MDDKTKKLIITLIIGFIVAAAVICSILFIINFDSSENLPEDSSELSYEETTEMTKDSFQSQVSDISEKFSVISAEMLEADGTTIKPQYSESQKNKFTLILTKISEMNSYLEDSEKINSLTKEQYFSELSAIVNEIQDLTADLDNDIHTNKEAFKKTFTDLTAMFNSLTEKIVSEDGKTLKDEYKQYQSDFDDILNETASIASYVEEKNQDQTYYDNLTEKGNSIIQKIKSLSEKANISLE